MSQPTAISHNPGQAAPPRSAPPLDRCGQPESRPAPVRFRQRTARGDPPAGRHLTNRPGPTRPGIPGGAGRDSATASPRLNPSRPGTGSRPCPPGLKHSQSEGITGRDRRKRTSPVRVADPSGRSGARAPPWVGVRAGSQTDPKGRGNVRNVPNVGNDRPSSGTFGTFRTMSMRICGPKRPFWRI